MSLFNLLAFPLNEERIYLQKQAVWSENTYHTACFDFKLLNKPLKTHDFAVI